MQEFSGLCNPSLCELNSNQLTRHVAGSGAPLGWVTASAACPLPLTSPQGRGSGTDQLSLCFQSSHPQIPKVCISLVKTAFLPVHGASLPARGRFKITASAQAGCCNLFFFLHCTAVMEPRARAQLHCGVFSGTACAH